MDTVMDWLSRTFLEPSAVQAIVVILSISVLGLQLGKIKVFNFSLGITFVFFMGILAGHFGLAIEQDVLFFAQNLGLVIFIYALGLQVGPGFFHSFKKGGLQLNLLSLAVVAVGLLLVLVFYKTSNIPLPNILGIFAGAVTNTPALGAAQDTFRQIYPNDSKTLSDMALACAVAYPLGVVGVMLAIFSIRKLTVSKDNENANGKKKSTTYIGEFQVTNPAIGGNTILEIMKLSPKKFVISRVWKDGKVSIPTSDTRLDMHDHLLVISSKADVENIKVLFGEQENVDWNKEDIDWNSVDESLLISRKIIITRSKLNGVKLGALKLRNNYGINITRINRVGMELLPSPDLALQVGDRLTVVGEAASIDNVVEILGDEVKRLKEPNLIAIFLGIVLGLILGALPIPFLNLSVPLKLGIAGGPVIVGILMGAFGPRFHITTYTTQSANLMLRQFGLVVYLACLGINAGGEFFNVLIHGDGVLWIGIGFVLTMVPILLVGSFASKVMKLDYANVVGMLCGSMANPMALNYANSTIEGDETDVAYATVYPASMFIRLIAMQVILLMFL